MRKELSIIIPMEPKSGYFSAKLCHPEKYLSKKIIGIAILVLACFFRGWGLYASYFPATEELYTDGTGAIGIGTTTPLEQLDVDGAIKLGTTTNTNTGTIRWDSTNFQGYNGTGWVNLDQTGGATVFTGLTDTPSSYTAGSVLFTSGSAVTEDNSNLFWDDTNNRLGIGTTSPGTDLEIKNTVTGATISIDSALSSHNAGINFKVGGASKWTLRTTGTDDDIGFYDGGTYRLYIDKTAGNVGIGTSAPTENLHIKSVSGVSTDLGLDENGIGWRIRNDQGDNRLAISSVTGSFDTFSERLTITSTGNVGIGNTIPSSPLYVRHPLYTVSSSGTNYKIIQNIIDNISFYDIDSGVSESGYRMGLNIAVHEDTPTLEGTLANQTGVRIQYGAYNNSGVGTITNSYGLYLQGLSSGNTTITNKWGIYQTGESFKNYFSGNVGIGTTAPVSKLDVEGDIRVGDALSINNDNSITTAPDIDIFSNGLIATEGSMYLNIDSDNTSTTDKLYIGNNTKTSSATNLMVVQENGNVGIGTSSPAVSLDILSPSVPLQMKSMGTDTYIKLITSDGLGFGYFGIRGATDNVFFSGSTAFEVQRYGGSTSLLHVDTSSAGAGNVGIGRIPSYKLDVSGDIRATNYRSSDGTVGYTGTFTFVDNASITRTLTIKNGLITAVN